MFWDIPAGRSWLSAEPVAKGWSSDKKYLVQTGEGQKLLLRLSPIEMYDSKKKEFAVITKFSGTGVSLSVPLEFGTCAGGQYVYMLLTWLEGSDLEQILPTLPPEEQYRLGRQAGDILQRFHSLPLAAEDVPTETKQAKKLRQLARYESSALRQPGDEAAVQYVKEHIGDIWQAPPAYLHGDFHPGNLIYREDDTLGVIDFNRWEVGDPWEEFYKLQSFGTEVSIPYCVGQIDAYFDGAVPESFWRANALYVAQASLYSIKWAEPFGQADVEGMIRRYEQAIRDFDGFRTVIPRWYTESSPLFTP